MGAIAAAWFQVTDLGLVIGLAMVTVLVAAALGGILSCRSDPPRRRSGGVLARS